MLRFGTNVHKELQDRILALHCELMMMENCSVQEFDEKIGTIHALRLKLLILEGKEK